VGATVHTYRGRRSALEMRGTRMCVQRARVRCCRHGACAVYVRVRILCACVRVRACVIACAGVYAYRCGWPETAEGCRVSLRRLEASAGPVCLAATQGPDPGQRHAYVGTSVLQSHRDHGSLWLGSVQQRARPPEPEHPRQKPPTAADGAAVCQCVAACPCRPTALQTVAVAAPAASSTRTGSPTDLGCRCGSSSRAVGSRLAGKHQPSPASANLKA
jgi:hypothetical protein